MKIKTNMIHRTIADEHILIPTGESAIEYSGIFALTEIGAEIWEMLVNGMDEDAIKKALLEEYEADEATISRDFDEFAARLIEAGLVEE